jgi:hypothetical protein
VVAKKPAAKAKSAALKRVAVAQPEPAADRPVTDKETTATLKRVRGAKEKAEVNSDPLGGLRL